MKQKTDSTIQENLSTKPFSLQEIYERTVTNYANLALNPATLDHARFMVRQLTSEYSEMFGNLGQDVKRRIDEIRQKG
jgi:hypothetical protein